MQQQPNHSLQLIDITKNSANRKNKKRQRIDRQTNLQKQDRRTELPRHAQVACTVAPRVPPIAERKHVKSRGNQARRRGNQTRWGLQKVLFRRPIFRLHPTALADSTTQRPIRSTVTRFLSFCLPATSHSDLEIVRKLFRTGFRPRLDN